MRTFSGDIKSNGKTFKLQLHLISTRPFMRIPKIEGIIERRILINFTADPKIIKQIIPAPFRPKIYREKSIVGICLIRLKQIRPTGLPGFLGISSENAAHRIAVEWEEDGETKEGVFIPRRDSSSFLNSLAGGRIFPGRHFRAKFDVEEVDGHYTVECNSSDGTHIAISAHKAEKFDSHSTFENIENASRFFENGSIGYSPNLNKFEGLKLKTIDWKVEPLHVISVQSSFFENEKLFPENSVVFDHALLMTEVKHEWHSVKPKLSVL